MLLTVVVASVINAGKVSQNVACHKIYRMCFSFSRFAVNRRQKARMHHLVSSVSRLPFCGFLIEKIFPRPVVCLHIICANVKQCGYKGYV